MKPYKQLIQDLLEAWPGTPEYKKRFGDNDTTGAGSRHNISSSGGVTRATRRYNQDTGESEEATKSREDAKEAPAKRGRGRPPGKYGTYKKKVKESLDIIESLETEEEIDQFIDSLDEESYLALEDFLVEEEDTEKCPECGKVHEGECEDDEDEESVDEATLSAKAGRAGKDLGKPGKNFDKIAKKAGERYGSEEAGKRVAGAILKKMREETEEVDEAMSHQAKTTMKHIKNPTAGEKQAAKDIKPGKSGYADRIAMLKSAQARGALKTEK